MQESFTDISVAKQLLVYCSRALWLGIETLNIPTTYSAVSLEDVMDEGVLLPEWVDEKATDSLVIKYAEVACKHIWLHEQRQFEGIEKAVSKVGYLFVSHRILGREVRVSREIFEDTGNHLQPLVARLRGKTTFLYKRLYDVPIDMRETLTDIELTLALIKLHIIKSKL